MTNRLARIRAADTADVLGRLRAAFRYHRECEVAIRRHSRPDGSKVARAAWLRAWYRSGADISDLLPELIDLAEQAKQSPLT